MVGDLCVVAVCCVEFEALLEFVDESFEPFLSFFDGV